MSLCVGIIPAELLIDLCVECGCQSDYGVHSVCDGDVVSQHYCKKCYRSIKQQEKDQRYKHLKEKK